MAARASVRACRGPKPDLLQMSSTSSSSKDLPADTAATPHQTRHGKHDIASMANADNSRHLFAGRNACATSENNMVRAEFCQDKRCPNPFLFTCDFALAQYAPVQAGQHTQQLCLNSSTPKLPCQSYAMQHWRLCMIHTSHNKARREKERGMPLGMIQKKLTLDTAFLLAMERHRTRCRGGDLGGPRGGALTADEGG